MRVVLVLLLWVAGHAGGECVVELAGGDAQACEVVVAFAVEVDERPAEVTRSPAAAGKGAEELFVVVGEGVVVSCNPIRNDHEVIVDFRTAETKKLLLSIAPLESIHAS